MSGQAKCGNGSGTAIGDPVRSLGPRCPAVGSNPGRRPRNR
jgi:hypothetical protein